MNKLLTAAIALASATIPAGAQNLNNASALGGWHQISQSGYWSAFGGRNDHDAPQCVAFTNGLVGKQNTSLSVKFDASHADIMGVIIGKENWSIPDGKQMRVVLQVDSVQGRYFWGHGNTYHNEIEIDINKDDNDPVTGEPAVNLLVNLLQNGKALNIWFPDGNEPAWQASLSGAKGELYDFLRCMGTIAEAANPQSTPQPAYGNSQPYGAAPRQQLPPTQQTTTNPYQKL